MAHAGFDISGFPGTSKMATIKSTTNFEWCGFYLGPAPSHKNKGWMAHRADLVGQGWGLAPLYVGLVQGYVIQNAIFLSFDREAYFAAASSLRPARGKPEPRRLRFFPLSDQPGITHPP